MMHKFATQWVRIKMLKFKLLAIMTLMTAFFVVDVFHNAQRHGSRKATRAFDIFQQQQINTFDTIESSDIIIYTLCSIWNGFQRD